MYGGDNQEYVVMFYMNGTTQPGAWYPSTDGILWVDSLKPYIRTTNVIVCPSVRGGSLRGGFGIAMNHPEIGGWRTDPSKISAVKHPSETIPYADTGLIANHTERNPDLWIETKDEQALYYRTPTNQDYYSDDPERPVNRHGQRCNSGFMDGHGAAIRVSAMGLQYFPGKGPAGQAATGNPRWGSGNNGIYDSRWMWDLE